MTASEVTAAPAMIRTPGDTPVSDALSRLLDSITVLATETVSLGEALGRFSAADVRCLLTLPGCDNSAMDGYAVRAADCAGAPLPVAVEVRAGDPVARHAPGTATPITTGAPVPRGADSVVRLEDTVRLEGAVGVHVAVKPGQNIRRAGEDARRGDRMLAAGRQVRSVDVAACAAAGVRTLAVRRRPTVALITGGDELVPPGDVPQPHQAVDCVLPMLEAAVIAAGGRPVVIARVADEPEAVREALRRAAASDLVVSAAGVSVGEHDHVRAALEELGGVDVWGIAARPGKPLVIGRVGRTPFIGLPGNPVSSAVMFELFARVAIRAMQGAAQPLRRRFAVRLAEPVSAPRELETYVRITLSPGNDGIAVARLSGGQGSAMLRSLAAAAALAVVPAGVDHCTAGTVVTAIELG
jgi:molybdopterin molybdotransferase